jgi:hypothetical protein
MTTDLFNPDYMKRNYKDPLAAALAQSAGLSSGPTMRGKLGESMGAAVTSPDMQIPMNPSPDMALSEVGGSMGNVEELGSASAKLAGMDSIPESTGGSEFVAAKGAAAASGVNPWVLGASVGMKLLEGQRQMRERERQERFAAQQEVKSNMTQALSKLANIGSTLGL